MQLPMHITLGLYNTLVKQIEEENKHNKEEEKKYKSSVSNVKMPNVSMPSNIKLPNGMSLPSSGSVGGLHL